jgi:hypothetical protein
VAIALIALAMFAIQFKQSSLFTLPADLYPPSDVATVWGLAGAAGSFGGMAFTPLVGWLVQHVSYAPVFGLVSAMHLVSVAVVALMIPRIEAATSGWSRTGRGASVLREGRERTRHPRQHAIAAKKLQDLEDAGALRAARHGHARWMDENAGLHAACGSQRPQTGLERRRRERLRGRAQLAHGREVSASVRRRQVLRHRAGVVVHRLNEEGPALLDEVRQALRTRPQQIDQPAQPHAAGVGLALPRG